MGIVTEGDLLRRKETDTVRRRPRWIAFFMSPGLLAAEYTHAAGRLVSEIMTRDVVTVAEDAPLRDIVDLMERHRLKRLPVMCGRKIVGIISRRDLLRALVGSSRAEKGADGDDEVIRERLLRELRAQPWAPMIDVFVHDGKVKLAGTIIDDRQRDAIRVIAENVPGVKSIEDRLTCIDWVTGSVTDRRAV